MFQTDEKKLQRKVIAEDLDYDDTVKYGLALEQGAKKVDEIRGVNDKKEDDQVAALEEQVRMLKAGAKPRRNDKSAKDSTTKCKTCTQPTHE